MLFFLGKKHLGGVCHTSVVSLIRTDTTSLLQQLTCTQVCVSKPVYANMFYASQFCLKLECLHDLSLLESQRAKNADKQHKQQNKTNPRSKTFFFQAALPETVAVMSLQELVKKRQLKLPRNKQTRKQTNPPKNKAQQEPIPGS